MGGCSIFDWCVQYNQSSKIIVILQFPVQQNYEGKATEVQWREQCWV